MPGMARWESASTTMATRQCVWTLAAGNRSVDNITPRTHQEDGHLYEGRDVRAARSQGKENRTIQRCMRDKPCGKGSATRIICMMMI
mmetsp:Transcript_3320/g.20689  ORF Transcript_3320/g.20689 Transcript_3320/m.20689 type:complete len:87 (+) Transcript_3320:1083-1343(+)